MRRLVGPEEGSSGGKTPVPAPKDYMGVEGSVFGPEESERRILSCLAERHGDRRGALMDFLQRETGERAARAPTKEAGDRWQDARNVYVPVFG